MKKRMISLLLCLCMVFSLLPTVVFASETETSTTVYDWDQENACYKSTTDGLIKYNDNDPDGGLPETLKTLYSNINAAADEEAKVAAIDNAKAAGTITENLANRLKQLVHVYTDDELAYGVSLQDSTITAKLNGDELEISGTGALPTYTRYNAAFWAPADNSVAMRPWNTEKLGDKAVSSVRFALGITEVGAYAFYYQKRDDITSATFNQNLKIHLPDSLEKMSQATFMSLNASDIAVPSSVTTLSTRLFGTLSRLYVLGDPEIVVPSESTSSFAVGSGTTVYAKKGSKLSSKSGITNMTLEKVDAIGACGTEEDYTSELVWMVQDDTLTIAAMDGGNGMMADYTDGTSAPWNAYASQIRKIVLGAGVANIGTNAFAGLNSLTNVTVPNSVQIDENAKSPFGTTLKSISFSFNEGSSFANWLKKNDINHSADVDELGRKKLTKAVNELFHAYIGETDIAAKMTNDGTLTIYPAYSLFNNTEVPRIEGYRKNNTAFPWFDKAYGTTFDENDYKGSTKDLVNLKEIVWDDGITDTGAYLFNDANNWPTGAVKFRIPDSVTKIGGALIGNKSAGPTCIIPENVISVGFWFGGKDAKNVYILNPNLTDIPVVKKGETPSSSGGDNMARNIGCGFDYTVHVKEGSAAHKKLATGNYTIEPHTDMGACGAAPYSSEVFWLYDENTKTLTINGSGKMKNYASTYAAPWAFYDVDKVTVDDGITHIGDYAFASLKKITKDNVKLDSSVTVADTAFATPDAQGRLPLPLTSDLYYNAYIGETTIAAKMSTDGVITIYPTDTSKDTKVPGINGYQGDNTLYPWYAVYGQTFDKNHWDGTGVRASEIKEIVFANGLTEIGGYLFNDVKGMPTSVKVRIPDSVTMVGGALVGTKNHGASIATGVQMTGVGFWYAGKATNVYILYPDMTGIPFPATGDNADLTRTIAHATGDKVTVHVKEGSAAYSTLTKGGTVYTNVITHTDLGACGVAPYSSETFWTYDEGSKTLTVLGDGAIRDYDSADAAPWSSRDVETLVVQDGITRIGNNAFAALKNLKTVNVDGSVTEVADNAFATENGKIVDSLQTTQFLTSSAAMKAWLEEHGTSALGTSGVCDGYRWSVESGVLTIKVDVTDTDTTDVLGAGGKTAAISDVIAEGAPGWVAYKSIITKVQLGYGITGIGANAFKDMPVLASVELPSTLEKIGAEAFVNTPKLTKLYLPKNATDVAENAFGTESSDAKNLTIQISPIAPDAQKNLKSQGNTTITVDSSKNLNVLLIGNSYFGALSGYLKDIARGLGANDAMIANYYFGGYSGNLKSYVEYINKGKVSYKDNDDYSGYKENGFRNHSYNNNPLSMGIEAEDWDYVVMETWGKNEPAGVNGNGKLSEDPNLTTLKEYILKYAPQAKVSLYHVYSCGYLAKNEEPVETLTQQWQRYVNGADDGLARIVTHVIPASTLIQNARLTYLNADGGDLLRNPKPADVKKIDITHLNQEGDYINAIMMYETLTGKSAAGFDHGTFDNHKEAFYHKLVDVTKAAGMKKLTYAYVKHNNTITYYDSLSAAANAAVAGDTLSLLAMPKSETPLTLELKKGITVETFGSSENHTIVLTNGGNITENGLVAFAGCEVDDNAEAAAKAIAVNPVTGELREVEIELPLQVSITAVGNAKPLFLGDTVTVTTSTNPQGAEIQVTCSSDALAQVGNAARNEDGSLSYTFKVVKITGSYVNATFTANAKTDADVTASAQTTLGMNLRNRIHLTLKDADGTAIKDATVIRRNNFWSDTYQPKPDQMTYIKADSEYRCDDWAVANDDNGTIIITLNDGRTATLTTDKNGHDILALLKTGTEEIYCEYTFPAYKVTGKLFFNGEPVLYDGRNQMTSTVSGNYGTDIPYTKLENWAKEYVLNTLDVANGPAKADVEIKKDGGTVALDETKFGDAGKLQNYVYVNVKTYYTVTFMNGSEVFAKNEDVLYGTATPVPTENPTREGYEFLGWAEVVGDELKPVTDKVTRTVTYQAQWKNVRYTVAYHGNGGVLASNSDEDKTTTTATIGQELTLKNASTFVRAHYDFVGWATNPDATVADYAGSQKFEVGYPNAVAGETYDLYAVWTKHVYTVSINACLGGNQLGWITNMNVTVGDDLLGAANAELDRLHSFQNKSMLAIWEEGREDICGYHADRAKIYSSKALAEFENPVFDGETTQVYINYLPNTDTPYKVEHYQEQLDGTYKLAETENLTGMTDTTATATDKGYTGFAVDETVEGTLASGTIAGDGSLVLKLYYTRNIYEVTFVSDGETFTTQQVKYGATATEPDPAPTKAGYDLDGWYLNDEAFNFTTAIEGNIQLTAKWTARKDTHYKVKHVLETLNPNHPWETKDSDELKGETDTTVTAKPRTTFKGFTFDEGNENNVTSGVVKGDGSLVLTLYYTRNTYSYEVRHIKQQPDGTYDETHAEVENLSGKFEAIATVNAKDYGEHYPTNNAGTKQNIKIEKDLTIDVLYDLDMHTLTFDAKGGTETGSITVRHGNTVAKPEDPKRSGYRFNGWFDDEKCREKHDFDALLVEDATVYAGWTKRSSGSSVQIESPNKPKKDDSLMFNTEDHFAFVNGYPDGTVKPTGDVTRAEVAAILYRVMDADCVKTYETTRCSFSDVVRGDWFNLYVATLENAGVIVDTRTNGKFRPNEAITRAELAAMLAQFADIKSAANSFNDVSARHWASDEIAVCAKMGWINGYPDGSFRPDATITRAEMMAMINRALGRTPKSADDLLSGMKAWRDNANVNAWYYLDVQEATNSHTYTKSGTHETWKKLR